MGVSLTFSLQHESGKCDLGHKEYSVIDAYGYDRVICPTCYPTGHGLQEQIQALKNGGKYELDRIKIKQLSLCVGGDNEKG